MRNIMLLEKGIDVRPLSLALKRNPHLWNQNRGRTESHDSPHREVDDIWIRFAGQGENGTAPHDSIWYPASIELPEAKSLAFMLMAKVSGERLGGILITRIPPGGKVYPHVDDTWHAKYYDKYAVQVESGRDQGFCFKDESLISDPGDLYWFNNQAEHWVINNSTSDRITYIACIRHGRSN